MAYYSFDEKPTLNAVNADERVTYSRVGSGKASVCEEDYARFGKVVHQFAGDNGKNSYSRMPNPLQNKDFDGFTVSLWVKRGDATDYYNALWAFTSSTSASFEGPRLYLTGNSYVGYNDKAGNWFDVNHPDKKVVNRISADTWCLVTLTYSKANGLKLYKDGAEYAKMYMNYTGSASQTDFDSDKVLGFVRSAKYFALGLGSFWGSAEACFDDLMIYSRELSADDVKGLNTLLNRVNDFDAPATSISQISIDGTAVKADSKAGIYDLFGRRVAVPSHGIYIVNGRKVLIK